MAAMFNNMSGIGLIQIKNQVKAINGIWYSSSANVCGNEIHLKLFESSNSGLTLKDTQWSYSDDDIVMYKYTGQYEEMIRVLLCQELISNDSLSLNDLYQRVVEIFTIECDDEDKIHIDAAAADANDVSVDDPVLSDLEKRVSSLQCDVKDESTLFDRLVNCGFERVIMVNGKC